MARPNIARAGRTFSFGITIQNDYGDFAGAATFSIKRYPDSTAVVSGDLTYSDYYNKYIGNLTETQTTTLGYGEWWIIPVFLDSDENLGDPEKLYISRGWQS